MNDKTMTVEQALKARIEDARRNERHRNRRETEYWFHQYKQIAIAAVEALTAPSIPERTESMIPAYFNSDERRGFRAGYDRLRDLLALATAPAPAEPKCKLCRDTGYTGDAHGDMIGTSPCSVCSKPGFGASFTKMPPYAYQEPVGAGDGQTMVVVADVPVPVKGDMGQAADVTLTECPERRLDQGDRLHLSHTETLREGDASDIDKFLKRATDMIEVYPHLYVEIARTRTTEWMAHLLTKPSSGMRLAQGQGLTAADACKAALESMREGGSHG